MIQVGDGKLGSAYGMILAKKRKRTMAADVLGRLLKVGDVCGFASRRRSQTNLEVVVIRELLNEGVKGDKLTKTWAKDTGWTVKRVPTHLIVRPQHLIITGLTEKEAVELMKIRSERR